MSVTAVLLCPSDQHCKCRAAQDRRQSFCHPNAEPQGWQPMSKGHSNQLVWQVTCNHVFDSNVWLFLTALSGVISLVVSGQAMTVSSADRAILDGKEDGDACPLLVYGPRFVTARVVQSTSEPLKINTIIATLRYNSATLSYVSRSKNRSKEGHDHCRSWQGFFGTWRYALSKILTWIHGLPAGATLRYQGTLQ